MIINIILLLTIVSCGSKALGLNNNVKGISPSAPKYNETAEKAIDEYIADPSVSNAKALLKEGIKCDGAWVRDLEADNMFTYAVKKKSFDTLTFLIEKEGTDKIADMGISNIYVTPVIFKFFKEKGINLNERILAHDRYFLFSAIKNEKVHLVKEYLKSAKVIESEDDLFYNVDINHNIYKGNTYLIEAVKVNSKEIVELLLEKGADANIKNDQGETALDIAREKGYEEIVELLQQYSQETN